ncbi:MAG: heparinase II/III family protein, partial [Verrucomicrobia bacterium]|nr:heparinase II/III family protein [Verrucomicrobiota bacterium]
VLPCLFAFAAALLSPLAAAPAGPHPASDEAWARLPAHPRLFATASQWQEIRGRLTSDPVSARLFAAIRVRAEALLTKPPVTIRQRNRGTLSGSMLEPAREIQGRVLLLAAMARLTDDVRFRDRALVELRLLTALPDWNPAVFLDTAEATLAVAVGYDWLFDTLTPADRDALAASLIEKGLRASFDSPAKMLTWVRGTNNWNQVCHGALVVGALAVAERDPVLARRTVDRAVAELHSSAKAYAPDGVYPEGPGYWAYGMSFHVTMLSALETALGDRCGLDTFPGFLVTADYLAQVTAPSGGLFNYADSSDRRGFEPALVWFARRLQQPAAMRWELDSLTVPDSGATEARSRFLPLALLWWDPALTKLSVGALPLHWKGDGSVPVAVHRSAWGDPRAVYLAIKGGRPGLSHGHMDVGSFILEADGVRWAVDPGVQNYGTLYTSGIDAGLWRFSQDSPRWTVFRIGADGHNIPRFDGAPQLVSGVAPIVRFAGTGATPYTQIDLSAVYADRVKTARRGAMLLPDRRVVFQDEWTASDHATTVTWQWLTRADVTLEPHAALLRQKGETLRLRIVEPADATLAVEDTARLLQAHDEPNPGLRRLVVRTTTAAGAAGCLVIVAEPGSATVTAPPAVRPLDAW